jgi:hypothetical protein
VHPPPRLPREVPDAGLDDEAGLDAACDPRIPVSAADNFAMTIPAD